MFLDSLTRQDIHEQLSYRFVEAASRNEALKLEAEVRQGARRRGCPDSTLRTRPETPSLARAWDAAHPR